MKTKNVKKLFYNFISGGRHCGKTSHLAINGTIGIMCAYCYNTTLISGNCSIDFKKEDDLDNTEINLELKPAMYCRKCKVVDNGIILDPNITEIVSVLNKKGYKTKGSCEGHKYKEKDGNLIYVEDKSYAYIEFEEPIVKEILSNPKHKLLGRWFEKDLYTITCKCTGYTQYQRLRDLRDWVNNLEEREDY